MEALNRRKGNTYTATTGPTRALTKTLGRVALKYEYPFLLTSVRGLPSPEKATDSRSVPAGVRRFKSCPTHPFTGRCNIVHYLRDYKKRGGRKDGFERQLLLV